MSKVEPPRALVGLRVERDEAAGLLELRSSWRSTSLARNSWLAAAALVMFLLGVASAIGPSGSPIQAAVSLIGMCWPLAQLVNHTHVRADASELTVWQRPIPLLGRRTFEWASVQSIRSEGRDVMLVLTSGDARRCMKGLTTGHALYITGLLSTHRAAVLARPKPAHSC